MTLKIPMEVVKALVKAGCSDKQFTERLRFSTDSRSVQEVEVESLSEKDVDALYDLCAGPFKDTDGAVGVHRKITTYRKLKDDVEGQPVGSLQALETAIKEYVKPSPNKWLFSEGRDGQLLAYYVASVSYRPPSRDVAAVVVMELLYARRGGQKERNVTWENHELGRRTVVELLAEAGYHLETAEAVKDYEASLSRYNSVFRNTGQQWHAGGIGLGGDWSNSVTSMVVDGAMSKVVVDDLFNDDEVTVRSTSAVMHSDTFWSNGAVKKKTSRYGGDEDDREEVPVCLPVHPYVNVFRLDAHAFYDVHVDNLHEYVWDEELIKRLVLDAEKKALVDMLVRGAGEVMEDIVKGKTGGVMVLSSGPPGVGKTLTAEVYGETVKRALYVVQCSQLGTDEETIEKKLKLTLARAERWGAIYLIDEADVYVRERGGDIQQNAIVGVFLRTLERYRGIMFLTTNRGTSVDDAILSRMTAHVKYDLPGAAERSQLWHILSENYGVRLSSPQVAELCARFPKASGRSVKNLLKLVSMLLRKSKRRPEVADFVRLAKFQDVDVYEPEGR